MTVWDTLIGQPKAIEVLVRAALAGRDIADGKSASNDNGTLAHSWLITGPPGSGRSVAGRCLAAALQCTGEPIGCGECSGCHTTMLGSNLDVKVVSTDKVIISIDEARELLNAAQDSPTSGRWRVIIVEDADRMSERTSNVLLKSLEEPPPRTIWILCAPTPDDLLVTIRSRCRQLQLGVPPAEDVAQMLAESEAIDYEKALAIARVAQSHIGVAKALVKDPSLRESRVDLFMTLLRIGSVGEAVLAAGKVVEQAKAQASEANEVRAVAEKAALLKAMGVEDGKRIPPALRAQFRELEEEQKRRDKRSLNDALDRTMLDLLSFFRDITMVQLGSATALINADLADIVEQWAARSTSEQNFARIEAVNLARGRLQTNAAPLLVIEALAVTLFDPRLAQ